jgi:hypothetical protein
MLHRTLRRLFRPRQAIGSPAELQDFLRARAAFVSQKAMYEYCRARAGVMWDKLMLEAAFVAELEHGRWQAFVAALSDLAVVAELVVRQHAADADHAAGLAEAAVGVLTAEPLLAEAGVEAAPAAAEIRLRVSQAAAAAPDRVYRISERAGGRIFALMPVHPSVRRADEGMIVNSVRFLMVRAYEDLEAAADGPRLAAALRRADA